MRRGDGPWAARLADGGDEAVLGEGTRGPAICDLGGSRWQASGLPTSAQPDRGRPTREDVAVTGARVTRVVLAEAIDPGARGARAAWRGRLDANTGTFGSGPRAVALVREQSGARRASSEKTDGAGATTFAPWRARARRGAPPHRRRRWCARIRCARASASANDDRSSVLTCSEGNGFEPSLAAWRGALRARCAQRLDSGDAIWPVGPWRPSGPSAQRPSAAWDNSATSSSSRSGAATTSASAPSERPPRVVEAHPASSATSKPAALSQGLRPAS